MEPTTIRADPATDNMPALPRNRLPQKFVFLLLFAMGVILISLGAYARYITRETWIPELSIALGVAIAAPGILSYLYRRYLLEDIRTELEQPANAFKARAIDLLTDALEGIAREHLAREETVREDASAFLTHYRREIFLLDSAKYAGLHGLYQSRRDAIGAFRDFLRAEDDQIVIVGSSLLGFLQDPDREYEEARDILRQKRDKVKIRFLLTHPMIADLRARQENRRFTEIGQEIVASLRILLDDWKLDRATIRLYKGTPTCFGVRTGHSMLLNVYPYMKEAYASPCFIALKGGYFYDHYDNSHFRAWGSAMAHPVPDPDELLRRLPEFAQKITDLMGDDPERIPSA